MYQGIKNDTIKLDSKMIPFKNQPIIFSQLQELQSTECKASLIPMFWFLTVEKKGVFFYKKKSNRKLFFNLSITERILLVR